MQTYIVFIALLALTYLGFKMGRARAVTASEGRLSVLHSLPAYHGLFVAIWCGIPSFLLVALWVILEPSIVTGLVVSDLPQNMQNLSEARLNLLLNDIRNIATGNIASGEPEPAIIAAAERYGSLLATSAAAKFVLALCVAIAGIAWDAAISKRIFGPQHCGTRRNDLFDHRVDDRHFDDGRHCPVAAF